MFELLKSLYEFLKTGKVYKVSFSLKIILKELFLILFLTIILFLFSILIISVCSSLLNINIPSNNTVTYLNSKGLLYSFLISVIIAPIAEECGYRLLLKYTPLNISLSVTILFYFLLSNITLTGYYLVKDYLIYKLISSVIFGVIVYRLVIKNKYNILLANYWSKHSRLILYFSIIFFSFSHIINFNITVSTILLIALYTLPQTVYGVTFSYTRLKYGIIYSIILHLTINTLPIIPRFLDYMK